MEIQELADPVVRYLEDLTSPQLIVDPTVLWATTSSTRTRGLHLSTITQDIYLELHRQDTKDNEREPELLWLMGLAWEHLFSWGVRQCFPEFPDRVISLGEIEHEGILMTPDRVDLIDQCVVETKCTWKSAANWPLEKQWLWLTQVKAYCAALGFERARVVVVYVNGGYWKAPCPTGTCVKAWEARFTERELKDNMAMIKNWAREKGWL